MIEQKTIDKILDLTTSYDPRYNNRWGHDTSMELDWLNEQVSTIMEDAFKAERNRIIKQLTEGLELQRAQMKMAMDENMMRDAIERAGWVSAYNDAIRIVEGEKKA